MGLFKIKPLLPDAVIDDPRADLKKALTVEQYKAGEEALFMPDGFNWLYLPYRELKAVIRARSLDSTDRWLVKYAVEKPAVRLLFRDSFRVLIVLPWGTNTDIPQNFEIRTPEDQLLTARNKWLLAHAESDEAAQGACVRLTGPNLSV